MKISQSDEITLREYLLGQLDPGAELTHQLEERIFTEPEFAEFAAVIEDEILEDYLEGVLDSADREAAEKHFLRPRQRLEKLQLAQLVNRSLKSDARLKAPNQASALGAGRPPKQFPPFSAGVVRAWFEAVACVLLIASFIYVLRLRHELRPAAGTTVQQLAAERERSAHLERQLQDLRGITQPSTMILSLIQPGIQRGPAFAQEQARVPAIQLGSGTKTIHVEIALQVAPAGLVDVRLENSAGKAIWTAAGQSLFRSGGAALLIVDVPAQGIETGEYRFVVAQPKPYAGTSSSFLFNASRL